MYSDSEFKANPLKSHYFFNNLNYISTDTETIPISQAEMQTVLEATIQIYLFPSDSIEALGVDQQQISLNEALSDANVEYRYELGLGMLVSHYDEIILITHDHWSLFTGSTVPDRVELRNAKGSLLLEMSGAELLSLILFHNGGILILKAPKQEDQISILAPEIVDQEMRNGFPVLRFRKSGWGID